VKPIKLTSAQLDAALGSPADCADCGAEYISVSGVWRANHATNCPFPCAHYGHSRTCVTHERPGDCSCGMN
jgi:hypothetical protein